MTAEIEFDTVEEGGFRFFKPAQYKDHKALLVEVKSFEAQRPGEYGPKDTIHARVTAFEAGDDLAAGEPSAEISHALVQSTILVSSLRDKVGKALVLAIGQAKAQPGKNPSWVWRNVSKDVQTKVGSYLGSRQAQREAALAAAPSFEDD